MELASIPIVHDRRHFGGVPARSTVRSFRTVTQATRDSPRGVRPRCCQARQTSRQADKRQAATTAQLAKEATDRAALALKERNQRLKAGSPLDAINRRVNDAGETDGYVFPDGHFEPITPASTALYDAYRRAAGFTTLIYPPSPPEPETPAIDDSDLPLEVPEYLKHK